MPAQDLKKRNPEIYRTALDMILPDYLLAYLPTKQQWTNEGIQNPVNLYQASLRLGVSYQATVCAFQRLGCFNFSEGRRLLKVPLTDTKRALLEGFKIENLENIDVWCLSEKEEETTIRANSCDLVVLKLQQNGSAGYRWNVRPLENAGFAILYDRTRIVDFEIVGTPSLRTIISRPPDLKSAEVTLEETCSWQRTVPRSNVMKIKYRNSDKLKEGLYRETEQ